MSGATDIFCSGEPELNEAGPVGCTAPSLMGFQLCVEWPTSPGGVGIREKAPLKTKLKGLSGHRNNCILIQFICVQG